MTTDTKTTTPKEPDQAYLKWAIGQQKARTTNSLLNVASAELPLDHERLDADPWLLNVQNGVINLRTGQLRPHRSEDFMTKICQIPFDPHAKCEMFLIFIDKIFDRDEDLIRFVQKAVGYSLTGCVEEQIFFLLYGTGANGKSTLVEVLASALGDYAATAPPSLLMAKKQEAHPTELADLFRKRFVITSEVKADSKFDEERIKALTGGDTIKARRMREDFWSFTPTHKFWISVNHRPTTSDNSEGFWRRVRMIPFTVTIPPQERDPKLLEKLKGELPGILAWAVRGCLLWQQEGLEAPESVRRATSSYRHDSDDLQAFMDECCNQRAGAEVQSLVLYNAYRAWVIARGENPVSHAIFSGRLKSYGLQSKKASSTYILGLELKPDSDPDDFR